MRITAILRNSKRAFEEGSRTATRFAGSRSDFNNYRRNDNNAPQWNQRGNQNSFKRADNFNRGNNYSRGNNYNRGNNSNRGNFNRNRNQFRSRDPREDDELLSRTTGRKGTKFGDGLMGQENYTVATGDEIKDIKWTDLIPKKTAEETTEDEVHPLGVSAVPTSELSKRRLLSLPLVNSLIHNRKYEWLTPVQAQTLVPILKGESVVVRAKTGTGKTAAFAIPILQKVLEAKQNSEEQTKVHALIVSPTRELAQQIADEIYKITQFGGLSDLRVQSLVGGVSKDRQIRAAGFEEGSRNRVADIVVATPGRLLDILQEEGLAERYFSNLRVRVFDEADQILDIGFEREMERARDIIDNVNENREIPLLLFSATADRKMQSFAKRQFGDRVRVVDTVPKNEPSANELVEQHAVACRTWADLYEAATKEITTAFQTAKENGEHFKAIVFLPTTVMVDHYERVLKRMFGRGSPMYNHVLGIHGQRKQQSRQVRADKFRHEKDAVLITTDVVARGMDFPKVSHVFQLGPPPDVSSYVHRIGRTARIGNSGKSYLFYTNHVRGYIEALNRENIKPTTNVYNGDETLQHELGEAFNYVLDGEDEANELLMSLMSYMTVLKSKFKINPQDFITDMQPFVDLVGLESLRMGSQMRATWQARRPSKGMRSSFGSSRRSRMRW